MKTKTSKLTNLVRRFKVANRTRLSFVALLGALGIFIAAAILLNGQWRNGYATHAQERGNAGQSGPTAKQSDSVWQDLDERQLTGSGQRQIVPAVYRAVHLNQTALTDRLASAPMEFTEAAKRSPVVMTLPMPDGKLARFAVVESPMMEPGLAAKMPEFRSYRGQGIDDPTATMRCDWSPAGFHAMIIGAAETVYIDPYALNDTENYISYRKTDYHRPDEKFECGVGAGETKEQADGLRNLTVPNVTNGTTLRTYRFAVAAAGEYTAFIRQAGDTDDQAKTRAQTAINVGVNRLNTIYERDLAVRLVVIANNLNIIYTNAATDPYNGDDSALIDQNQANLTNVATIGGPTAFDVGHLITTQGAGLAAAPSACDAGSKAQGKSGLPNPINDPFFVDMVAHEVGHQFGAQHSYNGVDPAGGGCTTRSVTDAFEPSSGSTIMSYAGVCDVSNLQQNSDAMFSVRSLEVMTAYITGDGNCGTPTATGNTPPTVTAPASFNIPKNTPFTLTATGSDPDGDALTYSWEEYNLGPQSPPDNDADQQARPIFRVFAPTASPSRTFPRLDYILNNANLPPVTYACGTGQTCATGEASPSMARTLNFQVVARDNRAGGGGINTAATQVVVAATGPFQVTAPNTNVTWAGGSNQTVTWAVNGTATAPINAANVRISLSTDGGQTFPVVLKDSTPNDGTESVIVPNIASTTARIKIEAVGNIFFDITDTNFTITATNLPTKASDFDGDGRTDLAVFRPSSGVWYVQRSSDGVVAALQFGINGDVPVPGDYDGDGKTDFAVFRPSSGSWYILQSSNGSFRGVNWGLGTDKPVPADYDGDGKTDIAVWRPSTGNFYVLQSSNGAVVTQNQGINGDQPVPGDYSGIGRAGFAVFRPSQGTWYTSTDPATNYGAVPWGISTDHPVPGNYDGDGRTDEAVFRASEGAWYIRLSSTGQLMSRAFGLSSDITVQGDYDGDGKTDVAVWRPSSGTWYILNSGSGAVSGQNFGLTGDIPIPAAYFPN